MNRPKQTNCQNEPAYPDHETELFLFRYPNHNFKNEDNMESDYMCEDCESLISEEEWEMFGGKCEECALEDQEN